MLKPMVILALSFSVSTGALAVSGHAVCTETCSSKSVAPFQVSGCADSDEMYWYDVACLRAGGACKQSIAQIAPGEIAGITWDVGHLHVTEDGTRCK